MIPQTRDHGLLAGRRSILLSRETLASYDVVLIATDHDVIDYVHLAANSKLVVDTRNACARAGVSGANVVKA
jgi:UDP-N-acetyl-D-glucosamine dehydrogenase